MKNKGFTLIEMVITIALLALVGVVVSTNVLKLINNQKEEKKEEVKLLMEEAACTYAILNNATSVTGTTLIGEGLIDEVINGYNVSDYRVAIYFVNNERICELQGDVE